MREGYAISISKSCLNDDIWMRERRIEPLMR